MALRSCLFSESSIVETGLWCDLNEGIDPTCWARVCRFIGHQTPDVFETIVNKIQSIATKPKVSQTTTATATTAANEAPPLFSLGPSGIGGPYQIES